VFTNDKNDLTRTLGEMEYLARQKTNFNQVEAKQKMAEWLAQDRRFDSYDAGRLIDRVHQAKFRGAHLDLDDPQLKRGGQPRPLDRWR
jgi:hypothetical protein